MYDTYVQTHKIIMIVFSVAVRMKLGLHSVKTSFLRNKSLKLEKQKQ